MTIQKISEPKSKLFEKINKIYGLNLDKLRTKREEIKYQCWKCQQSHHYDTTRIHKNP
jgi:ribosomal protein L44E